MVLFTVLLTDEIYSPAFWVVCVLPASNSSVVTVISVLVFLLVLVAGVGAFLYVRCYWQRVQPPARTVAVHTKQVNRTSAARTPPVTLAACGGERNVTVWRPSVRPSVCLSVRRHTCTYCDSSGINMWRGQRMFRPDNKEDRNICSIYCRFVVQQIRNRFTTNRTRKTVLDRGSRSDRPCYCVTMLIHVGHF